jgi:hypothetical protein
MGMVDLDAYDYSTGSSSAIRATERTVVERIPPRQRVRRDAPIELPHILMLADDHDKVLIEPIAAKKDSLKKLYDFDLMEGGGHITGWLVEGEAVRDFEARLAEYSATVGKKYADLQGVPDEKRTARFVCTLVFIDDDGTEFVAQGKVEGRIGHELQGSGGFGYDPLFWPDVFNGECTLAEVPQERKNEVSHRGNALRSMRFMLMVFS